MFSFKPKSRSYRLASSAIAIALGTLIASAYPVTDLMAGNGSDRGGGGDVELEFVRSGEAAMTYLNSAPELAPGVDLKKVSKAIKDTKVHETDDVLYNVENVKKVALNYPTDRVIRINREMWKAVQSIEVKMALALHEYLGIARYERDSYTISQRILHAINSYECALYLRTSYEGPKYIADERTARAISRLIELGYRVANSDSYKPFQIDIIKSKPGAILADLRTGVYDRSSECGATLSMSRVGHDQKMLMIHFKGAMAPSFECEDAIEKALKNAPRCQFHW